MVFQWSMLDWRRGRGVNLSWVYVHCAIYETYLVWWFSRDLCSIGGGVGGVNLPWVYVHCALYETYLVWWFSRDLCSIGGGVGGSICHGYMCILQYVKLIGSNGIPYIYGQLEWGVHLPYVYVHSCFMWNLFDVVVFHGSMVNWRMGALVYVYSAICETYLV